MTQTDGPKMTKQRTTAKRASATTISTQISGEGIKNTCEVMWMGDSNSDPFAPLLDTVSERLESLSEPRKKLVLFLKQILNHKAFVE